MLNRPLRGARAAAVLILGIFFAGCAGSSPRAERPAVDVGLSVPIQGLVRPATVDDQRRIGGIETERWYVSLVDPVTRRAVTVALYGAPYPAVLGTTFEEGRSRAWRTLSVIRPSGGAAVRLADGFLRYTGHGVWDLAASGEDFRIRVHIHVLRTGITLIRPFRVGDESARWSFPVADSRVNGTVRDRSGTVINVRAAELFERRVKDAVAEGASLLHGNDRAGALYPPTVVDHIPWRAELVREETFGPVIPIIRVPDDISEVIRISNSTAYGLSSGVCTNRLDYITRFINELEVGTVNVWEVPGYRIEMSPFGGIKDSGLGYKEGVQEAMKSFTNLKTYSLPWGL